MIDQNNIGVICDLSGAAITGTAQAFEFQAGTPTRVIFAVHAEGGMGSPITEYDLRLQASYDSTLWYDVALRKLVDDSVATPQVIAAGAAVTAGYYSENLRGARYARLAVTGSGGAGVAGDKISVAAVVW